MFLFQMLRDNPAIKNNQKLVYWFRCFRHRKNPKGYHAIPSVNEICHMFWIESYGSLYPEKNIYLIDFEGEMKGFFAIYRNILSAFYVCKRFGFTPHIRVTGSIYNRRKDDNMFEYYFRQPEDLNYKDILQSRNIIHYSYQHSRWISFDQQTERRYIVAGYEINENEISMLADARKKYLRFQPDVIRQIQEDMETLLGGMDRKKTAGIHFRGGAFKDRVYGHPVPLNIEDYYPYIDSLIAKGFCGIFAATDDSRAVQKLKKRYGAMVRYYAGNVRSDSFLDAAYVKTDRKDNRYRNGYEVLRDMLTLASCNALVCGNSQVSIAARIEKKSQDEAYDYLKVIDKGLVSRQNYRHLNRYRKLNREMLSK